MNIAGLNTQTYQIYPQSKSKLSGQFSEAIRQQNQILNQTNASANPEALEIKPENLIRVRFYHMDDPPITIDDGLANLTEEKRQELVQKYDIHKMIPYSVEHRMLMQELKDLGIISDIPAYIPINSKVTYDEEGFASQISSYYPNLKLPSYSTNGLGYSYYFSEAEQFEATDLIDWYETSINKYGAKYEELIKSDIKLEDRFFVNEYISYKNITQALKDIFS